MNSELEYRIAEKKDILEIYRLVSRVFDQFVAPGYEEAGRKEFYKYIDIPAIDERFNKNHFMLVCCEKDAIVGVIEVRNNNHVAMLFVNKVYQGNGIARHLLNKAVDICKTNFPQLETVSVNSSPNAVTVYEKLGFKAESEEKVTNGIRFTPMTLHL